MRPVEQKLGRITRSLTLLVAALALSGCLFPGSDSVLAERTCTHYDRFFGTSEGAAGWSHDGTRVIASARWDPNGNVARGLYVVSLPSGRWKRVLPGTSGFIQPDRCFWNPRDDRVIVDYIVGTGILDLSTGVHRILEELDGQPVQGAVWSPEGDSIWYWRPGDTRIIAAAGGPSRSAALPLFRPVGPWTFSPDGRRIAFAIDARDPDGGGWYRQEIAVINRDGTGYRVLTRLDGNSANPRWIHGGREILFDTIPIECYGRYSIMERYWCAVDVNSGRVRRLSQLLGSEQFQFSFPVAVDPAGERAVVVGGTHREGTTSLVGALFVTRIERPRLERLFRAGAPEMP